MVPRDLRRRRPRSRPRRQARSSPAHDLGKLPGPLAELPALRRHRAHRARLPRHRLGHRRHPRTRGNDWAYISSGTWSLVGTLLEQPRNSPPPLADNFTNLGAIGNRICFHKAVNGMWLLKQCMDAWNAAGTSFTVEELVRLASLEPAPAALLDVADPELGLVGNMPSRINAQLRANGHAPLDESPAGARTNGSTHLP